MQFVNISDRSRTLVAQSRETIAEIDRQLANAKARLSESMDLLARAKAMPALVSYGAIPRVEEVGKADIEASGPRRIFPAVTQLIEQIEDAASRDAGLAGRLIEDIMLAIQVVAEPSLLMGILLEGMAETVLERLSEEERRETAIALCTLLWDRINQGATE